MIDLHCHTDCSDGSVSPSDLLQQAIELRLEALAITDHDTLDGYDLIRDQARKTGFDLLCGVELSTRSDRCTRSAHLLGYFFSEPGESFRKWLKDLQNGRQQRNAALLERLSALGMEITWAELQAVGKRQIGRPHFARLMVEKGYVASLREVFDRYLCEGGLAWVDREEPALEEAVDRVVRAGGLTSLAHPGRITNDPLVLRALIAALIPHGLTAIECFHPEHSEENTRLYRKIAGEFGLAITGGSDYHGSYKPEVRLGTGRDGTLHIPASILHDLKQRFAETGIGASAVIVSP